MRVTTATLLRESVVTCGEWAAARETGSLNALENGRVKRYAITVHGPRHEDPSETFERAADLLFRYRLFPPHRMVTRVCTPDGRVRPAATIVQRIFLGSLGFESAVRVREVFDEPTFAGRRAGFSYVTLEGHPERGVESFAVLLHETGLIELTVTAGSRPGGLVVALGYPFARWFQAHSTREALLHFRSLVAYGGGERAAILRHATRRA